MPALFLVWQPVTTNVSIPRATSRHAVVALRSTKVKTALLSRVHGMLHVKRSAVLVSLILIISLLRLWLTMDFLVYSCAPGFMKSYDGKTCVALA